MDSTLRHKWPVVEGPEEPFTSGFLSQNPSLLVPHSNPNGTTIIGRDQSQQLIGNVYETFKIDRATFVQPDEDRQREKFANWLDFKAHNGAHNTALRGREPGTGLWFLEGFHLIEWMQNPASLLWLHGGVGCGKTVLCASTIEKIREPRRDGACRSLCFFYCSFQDYARQDLGALLRLFAAQLCSPTTVPQQLQNLYEECRREYPPRSPRNEELITCIVSILEANERLASRKSDQPTDYAGRTSGSTQNFNAKNIYLVIDALDEMPILEREDVLEFLQELANLKLQKLHILVTSRTEPSIVDALASQWVSVFMDAGAVNQDISIYVSRTIENNKKLRRQTPSTKELIRQRLVDGRNGMFRWAALKMEELKRIEVAMSDTILAKLTKLPKDLNESYERILTGIDDVLYQRAFTALRWLVLSPKPMFIEELIEACTIDLERVPVVNKDHRLTPLNMFEMLHDLITIRPTLQADAEIKDGVYTVVIAHFSIEEFLTGSYIAQSEARAFRIQNETAQLFIARSCLAYLFHYNSFDSRPVVHLLDVYKTLDLLSYKSLCRSSNKSTALPSWVPTFDVWPDTLPLDPGIFGPLPTANLFSTGGQHSLACYEARGDYIYVKGFTLDTVSSTGDVYLGEEYWPLTSVNDSSLRNGFNISTADISILKRPEGQTSVEAIWRTILADQWPPGQRLTESTLGQCKVPPKTKEEQEALLQESRLKEHLKFIRRRQLLFTEQGFIGLGPYEAEAGDVIAVMSGGAVPYVLRPVTENTTTSPKYKFIGECYVHSIMDGELVEEIDGAPGPGRHDTYFILV